MRDLRYLSAVASLELDGERCNGCRACVLVCPHGVFTMRDHRAAIVEIDACMECGACVTNCSEGALSVRPGVGCAFTLIKNLISGAGAPERPIGGDGTPRE